MPRPPLRPQDDLLPVRRGPFHPAQQPVGAVRRRPLAQDEVATPLPAPPRRLRHRSGRCVHRPPGGEVAAGAPSLDAQGLRRPARATRCRTGRCAHRRATTPATGRRRPGRAPTSRSRRRSPWRSRRRRRRRCGRSPATARLRVRHSMPRRTSAKATREPPPKPHVPPSTGETLRPDCQGSRPTPVSIPAPRRLGGRAPSRPLPPRVAATARPWSSPANRSWRAWWCSRRAGGRGRPPAR
jgi:hypothetical protein